MIETEMLQASPAAPAPARSRVLLDWYVEGGRSALLMAPRWHGLTVNARVIAAIFMIDLLLSIALQRLYIDGPATFYWQAITDGWFGIIVIAWLCILLREHAPRDPAGVAAPGAVHLFAMLLVQATVIMMVFGVLFVGLTHAGLYTDKVLGMIGIWALWLAPGIWLALAQITLMMRCGHRRYGAMAMAVIGVVGVLGLLYATRETDFWYPPEEEDKAAPPSLKLTQEVMEAQPQLLARRLKDMQPGRPGITDVYAISFAPYSVDVFRKESAMIEQVMMTRFDAGGRVLQLVNHPATVDAHPWATPLNLKRAIQHVATLMNPAEDILFMHLTSHGARDGELAADFWPMEVTTVKPADLKVWLDEAGITNRVISISACYSGSWIKQLASDTTLVVTASDADHTSYGCGRKSELTFFGRAMYDEQLRDHTLSFEQAHAAARNVIRQREQEAGKDDGYSNPQISVGAAIRTRLQTLQAELPSRSPAQGQ